jgi:hypothetical protein
MEGYHLIIESDSPRVLPAKIIGNAEVSGGIDYYPVSLFGHVYAGA